MISNFSLTDLVVPDLPTSSNDQSKIEKSTSCPLSMGNSFYSGENFYSQLETSEIMPKLVKHLELPKNMIISKIEMTDFPLNNYLLNINGVNITGSKIENGHSCFSIVEKVKKYPDSQLAIWAYLTNENFLMKDQPEKNHLSLHRCDRAQIIVPNAVQNQMVSSPEVKSYLLKLHGWLIHKPNTIGGPEEIVEYHYYPGKTYRLSINGPVLWLQFKFNNKKFNGNFFKLRLNDQEFNISQPDQKIYLKELKFKDEQIFNWGSLHSEKYLNDEMKEATVLFHRLPEVQVITDHQGDFKVKCCRVISYEYPSREKIFSYD